MNGVNQQSEKWSRDHPVLMTMMTMMMMMMMITEAAGDEGGVEARRLEGFPGIEDSE